MNSIMYFLLTFYTLIMFLKVLSDFIMKVKNFMKFLKGGLEIFQEFHEIFKYFNLQSEIFHRASLPRMRQCHAGECVRLDRSDTL